MIRLPHNDVASALVGPDSAAGAGVVAWDTEAWRIIAGRRAPPLVCASLAWRDRAGRLVAGLFDKSHGAGVVRRLIQRPAHAPVLAAHTASFDLAVLLAHLGRDEVWEAVLDGCESGTLTCTEVREKLLHVATGRANRHSPPTGLEACTKRLLGESIEGKHGFDSWRVNYHLLDRIPLEDWPADAVEYATLDAAYCLRVYEAQAREAAELFGDPRIPDEGRQVRKALALGLKSCHGFRCDPERVPVYGAELRRRVQVAEPVLERAGLLVDGTVKKASTQALVTASYQHYDLGTPSLTKTGIKLRKKGADESELVPAYVQTASDVLREVPCYGGQCEIDAGSIVEPCADALHILAWREDAAREVSRHLRHLERGTREPVNARIDPVLATGRASASAPPYQQMPRRPGARECIVPRPGYLLIGADLDSAELVSLGQTLLEWVGWSRLADVLIAGFDPHLVTGAMILSIGYAEAVRLKAAGDKRVKDARQLAKALNFGLPGGMGYGAFVSYAWGSWGLRVSEGEAKSLKRAWLETYPEMRDYFRIIGEACDAGGKRFNLRQPYSGRVRGSVGYCDGCNSTFQGRTADCVADAAWRVTRESWLASERSPLFGSRMILYMHDELICEAPEAQAPEAAERLGQIMAGEEARACPDLAPACKAEPWVARRWSKKIKAIRDASGRLMPWDDAA